ncbi:MAG: Xaa-Pro peptidase family protein [Pirellulales bacterium]|nr:Xaa-Pro peptidase family protein [Pirellulales bacterium]
MPQNPLLDISPPHCRERQARLLQAMQEKRLDLVILTRIEHVQWLCGPRFNWHHEPAAAIFADGHTLLVAPNKPPPVAAADEILVYEANSTSTLRNDQREKSSTVLVQAIRSRPAAQRVGIEYSCCSRHMMGHLQAIYVDVEPTLYHLRRIKHADELARLKHAIAATGAMYLRAREIVHPGVNELEVFNELQAAAVRACGEMLTGTGNDYASGQHGGPPRDRAIQAGELYILDLGPAYRGYFADNARVIAVGGSPTTRQTAAWQTVADVFPLIESAVKPGVRAREIYRRAQHHIAQFPGGVWRSHLGHGIGLFPHEAPHLNPNWDDTFQAGEVIAVEPAVYADEELRQGIRLENNYLVTEQGVELLSDFPLGL